MRYATTIAAVLVVGAILAASAAVYVAGDDSRDVRKSIEDLFDYDGYIKALEDHGLYPGNASRLLPGSLGAEIDSLDSNEPDTLFYDSVESEGAMLESLGSDYVAVHPELD